MRNKIKTGRRFRVALALAMLFCAMLPGVTSLAAEDTGQDESQAFDIDAKLLSSEDMTYHIQLTLCSREEDWEGTVRVKMSGSYGYAGCAYDTVISLPKGSRKQCLVRIPVWNINNKGATLKVFLLDTKDRVVVEKTYGRFFLNEEDVLSVGILSDSYQSLTYLDLGGEGVYYGGAELPVRLEELTQEHLSASLDTLRVLVIDNYNTGVLTDQDADHILQWVSDGGMLIVGTGKRADEVLDGLDFLGIECVQVREPGEHVDSIQDYGASLGKLSLAELNDTTGRYDMMDTGSQIMISSWYDGAVEIVPYALSDLGQPGQLVEDCGSYAWELLQNVNDYVHLRMYGKVYGKSYYDYDYIFSTTFGLFGNGGDHLNFGWLKFIVVAYVIFAGPALYLILRAMKKRDWYWIAVPVTALVGILLVYIAGSGFEVANTVVYSVTVEKLPGQDTGDHSNRGGRTYLHCYDADNKEWGLRLAERYDYVGAFSDNSGYGGLYGISDDRYDYHICREGNRVSFGINPDSGFEDSYFLAGTSQNMETGSITSDLKASARWGIEGTVTNGTSRDFKYFAVIDDDELYLYENLPAGQTCTLGEPVYTSRQGGYDSAMSAVMSCVRFEWDRDHDTIAALGTGIFDLYIWENYSGGTVIAGITQDWYPTVEEDCSETAYGCLYAVQ